MINKQYYNKIFLKSGYIAGFNNNSEYFKSITKILKLLSKILKKYNDIKNDEVYKKLNLLNDEINKCITRMFTVNSKAAKDELRKVIESKTDEFLNDLEQILNGK